MISSAGKGSKEGLNSSQADEGCPVTIMMLILILYRPNFAILLTKRHGEHAATLVRTISASFANVGVRVHTQCTRRYLGELLVSRDFNHMLERLKL